jgi:beta-N-acetylhexosaminidase
LAAQDPSVTVILCHDQGASAGGAAAELAGRAHGRPLLLVVRDLHRHAWQRELAAGLLALRPDVVVVEVGVPVLPPEGAAGVVCTHGAGRVNAEAAAEVLRGAR